MGEVLLLLERIPFGHTPSFPLLAIWFHLLHFQPSPFSFSSQRRSIDKIFLSRLCSGRLLWTGLSCVPHDLGSYPTINLSLHSTYGHSACPRRNENP